jgi:prolyl oligopeptidase
MTIAGSDLGRLICGLAFLCTEIAQAAGEATPPPADKVAVGDTYHGVMVEDPYQWLEQPSDPKVRQWTAAQTAAARDYLKRIPVRVKIFGELKEALVGKTIFYRELQFGGGKVFAVKVQPPKPQPVITVRDALFSGEERVVFDPATIDEKGLTSFDWFRVSPDGTLIAVSLSQAGSESGTLRFIKVQDGSLLDERIERVQYPTAGGSVAWDQEGKGVFYTRFPRQGERPEADLNFYQQTYYHRLGESDAGDRYEIGREFPRIAEIELERSPSGRWTLASVQNGDGGEYAYYLRGADGRWTQLADYKDGVKQAVFGGEEKLFLRSIKDAPMGKVLQLTIGDKITPLPNAKLVVPEGKDSAIQEIIASDADLLVKDIVGGPSRVRHFRTNGEPIGEVPTPELSGVPAMFLTEDGKFVLAQTSYVKPMKLLEYDPAARRLEPTLYSATVAVNYDNIIQREEFAVAQDGTRIPVILLMPKETVLDGKNPAILYGYGSYGISNTPGMDPYLKVWFDRGGIYAIANVRGGGEYGEPWHKAGSLMRKQTTIDDFAAAARMLSEKKYTSPAHLGAWGGSAGGITVGGLITQYPDQVKAACIVVGMLDALRTELEPNGEFNTTEFGTVKDPEQFKALLGYSPYHRVKPGTPYPAVLLMTGENDNRVASWHSKKMAAALQAATTSRNPVLLRVSDTAGHGIGTAFEERLNERADMFSFFFDQLAPRETGTR